MTTTETNSNGAKVFLLQSALILCVGIYLLTLYFYGTDYDGAYKAGFKQGHKQGEADGYTQGYVEGQKKGLETATKSRCN